MGLRGERSDQEIVAAITGDVDLIYDATAETGVHHFLSDYAREAGMPYLGLSGTFGGWGGKVIRIDPHRTLGCWLCYCHFFDDGSFPEPPSKEPESVQPVGCADPTFTGAGFDLTEIALAGVRMAVSTLCAGQPGAYPSDDWDVLTIALRDENGRLIAPTFRQFTLSKHPRCPRCNAQ